MTIQDGLSGVAPASADVAATTGSASVDQAVQEPQAADLLANPYDHAAVEAFHKSLTDTDGEALEADVTPKQPGESNAEGEGSAQTEDLNLDEPLEFPQETNEPEEGALDTNQPLDERFVSIKSDLDTAFKEQDSKLFDQKWNGVVNLANQQQARINELSAPWLSLKESAEKAQALMGEVMAATKAFHGEGYKLIAPDGTTYEPNESGELVAVTSDDDGFSWDDDFTPKANKPATIDPEEAKRRQFIDEQRKKQEDEAKAKSESDALVRAVTKLHPQIQDRISRTHPGFEVTKEMVSQAAAGKYANVFRADPMSGIRSEFQTQLDEHLRKISSGVDHRTLAVPNAGKALGDRNITMDDIRSGDYNRIYG